MSGYSSILKRTAIASYDGSRDYLNRDLDIYDEIYHATLVSTKTDDRRIWKIFTEGFDQQDQYEKGQIQYLCKHQYLCWH